MKKAIFLTFLLGLAGFLNAQSKKEQDRTAIKKMCGCYEVGFNFAETFNYSDDADYKPSKVKHDGALEWVELVEDEKNKIVMQHLLVAKHKDSTFIIKHWRQDWLYENTDFYLFDVDNHWKFTQKPKKAVDGQWTQKVFQVDDSPRYAGSASWIHADGRSFWENTADAPLPRRELTKRSDYNLMVRRNRHEITTEGWIHDQDNDKVLRTTGKSDVLLAQEKGFNTYKRVDDEKCKAAQVWWEKNKVMWEEVRKNWDKIFAKNKNLKLKKKVDNKKLYTHLFALTPDTKPKKIKKIITGFVEKR